MTDINGSAARLQRAHEEVRIALAVLREQPKVKLADGVLEVATAAAQRGTGLDAHTAQRAVTASSEIIRASVLEEACDAIERELRSTPQPETGFAEGVRHGLARAVTAVEGFGLAAP